MNRQGESWISNYVCLLGGGEVYLKTEVYVIATYFFWRSLILETPIAASSTST
jgi:hypothetical protein